MEPFPKSPHGQRICELFPYRWSVIEGTTQDSTSPDWQTVQKYPIRPRVLWAKHQDANTLIGVRFGAKTRYALLDIDAGSPALDELPTIQAALETIGIVRTVPIRSSWSGGVHLYCPLPHEVKTFALACALRDCLESQGLTIAAGELEIFPNVKAHGKYWIGEFTEYNAHRLPLQPASGSCLLDADLNPLPYGEELSRFFALWDNALLHQDTEALDQALRVARDNHRRRPRHRSDRPCQAWRDDLELTIAEGWTGHHQTNGMLQAIACYGRVFERLAGEALASYVERIATSRDGYERWCRHHHDIRLRSRVWARAAEKYYWPLGTEPARQISKYSPNEERANDARDRIVAACQQVKFQAIVTVRELVAELCRMARCSAQTLYRYTDLWHPDRSGVTAAAAGIPGDSLPLIDGSPPSDESLDMPTVTGNGGEYEGCSAEIPLSKKLIDWVERGGAGERGGLSTDAT